MEEKILDPTAWFQCRYCLKCIQGMNAFIDHKRENHSEEFYRDREEKSRQAAEEDERKGRIEDAQEKIRVSTGIANKGANYDGTQATIVLQGGPQKKPRRSLTNHAAELRTHSPSPPGRCGATSPNLDVCLDVNTDKELSEPVERKLLYAEEGEEQGKTCFDVSDSSGIDIQNSEDHGYQAPALVFKPTDKDVEDEVVIVHDDAEVGNSTARQKDISVMTSVQNLVTAAGQPQNCQATNDNFQVNFNSHSSRSKARMSSDNSPRSSSVSKEKYGTAIAVYLPNQNQANEDADKSKDNSNRMYRYSEDDSSSDDEVSIVATKIPEYPHYRKVGVSLFRYCNKFGVIGEVFPMHHHGSSPQENGKSSNEVVIYEAAMSQLSQSSSGIQADMDISISDIEPEISDSEIYTAEDGIEPDFTKLFELQHPSFDTDRVTTADEKAEEQAEGKPGEMISVENSKLKYMCLSCEQTFSTEREQCLHWTEEHDNFLPYQCKLCSESFTQENLLATHMIAHYEHNFPNCEKKIVENVDVHEEAIPRKKVEMDNLQKTEEPANENPSSEISETSLNNVGLEKRVDGEARAIAKGIKRGRGPYKKYKCPYCLKTAVTKAGLVQHLRIHTGEMPFKCRYCESTFRYNASCAAHEKRHPNHQPESTTYECKHCPVVFTTFIECNNHEMRHTNNDPYGCRSCPRFFPTLSLLNHHEMIEHQRSAEISVNNIDISGDETVVDVKQGLEENKNMIIEDLASENSFSINSMEPLKFQAGVQPIKASSVMQSKTARKKHSCSACSIVYSTQRELQRHQKYQCPKFYKGSLSDKNSNQSSDPSNIPSSIRSFKCNKCPRTFSYAGNLAKHQRVCKRSRKKIPELTCQYCGKVFTTSIARRCHENIHTGNKPFKCPWCPRAFSHFSYLYPHIASVHKGAKKIKLFSDVKTTLNVVAEGNQTSSHAAVGSFSKATLSSTRNPCNSSSYSKQKPSEMTTSVGYDGSGSEIPESRDDDPDRRDTADSRAVSRNRLTTRNKRLTCKQCGKWFTKLENYKAHITRVHCQNQCEICGKTYAMTQGLSRHKKEHLTKPCSCTVCKKLFATDDKLQLHIVRCHNQTSLFPCLCCEQKFMEAEELETHYRLAHVKKKTSYKCVFCSMEFSSSSSLWEHTGRNLCLGLRRRSRKSTVKKTPVLKSQTETGSQVSIVVKPEIFSDAEQNQCEGKALEETGEVERATEHDKATQKIGTTASQVRLEESGNGSPLTEPPPPHLEPEGLNEDSEECMDLDRKFYFNCSICKAEFRNNRIAELHIRWHRQYREKFQKLC